VPGPLSSDFYFQNFFPKNLDKKLGRVLQWRISGTARVRVRSAPPRPPFVPMKNTRGSFFPPAFRQRSSGARQHGCSVRNHGFQSAEVLPISVIVFSLWVAPIVPLGSGARQIGFGTTSPPPPSPLANLASAALQTPIVAAPFFKRRACSTGHYAKRKSITDDS